MSSRIEPKAPHARAGIRGAWPWRALPVLLVAAFILFALCTHRFGLNDEKYFRWSWRSDIPPIPLYPCAIGCAVPFFLAHWLFRRRPSPWLPILLVMSSMLALMLTCTLLQPRRAQGPGNRITDIVLNPTDTGYFTDAERLGDTRGWLGHYPQVQTHLTPPHVELKPPGPLLFDFALVHIFGRSISTAQLSAILIGFMATLCIPATYFFIRHFTADPRAAFFGASFLALCPSLLFFPQFDQCYPLLTVGVCLLWSRALRSDRIAYAIVCGAVGAMTTFITYLPIVLIFFLAGLAVMNLRPSRKGRIFTHLAAAAGGYIAFYLLLWLITGFNPVATFREAIELQHKTLANWHNSVGFPDRRLPGTIPWDLYSFAIGTGWISFLLVLFFFLFPKKNGPSPHVVRIALLCIGQLLFVAAAGLIQSETARVWIFMQPMLMLPIGLELARWPAGFRLTVYAALLLITAAVCQNMVFSV
jgi:hypothetical protein